MEITMSPEMQAAYAPSHPPAARPPAATPEKPRPLASIPIGEQFRGTYLLNRVELKKARNGKDFLHLEIGDPSGSLAGNKFDATPEEYRALQGVDIVDATGEVQTFNDRRSAR